MNVGKRGAMTTHVESGVAVTSNTVFTTVGQQKYGAIPCFSHHFSAISITISHFLSPSNASVISVLAAKVIEVRPFFANYRSARVRARERIFYNARPRKIEPKANAVTMII